MQRKQFIKAISYAAGAAVMPGIWRTARAQDKDSIHPVIIVGTGYGGAVAALRLAQRGIRVLMLEMGADWPASGRHDTFSKMLFPDRRSTWLRSTTVAPFGNLARFKPFTGVLDRMEFPGLHIYAGRGVGGGSLVNGGMAVTPRRAYLESLLPQVNMDELYRRYFPMASQMLKVNSIDPDFYRRSDYYRFSRTGEAQARAAGYRTVMIPNVYDFAHMQREEAGSAYRSALDGEVIYGNNAGKNSLDKNYLAQARATGLVRILPLHEVMSVREIPGGFSLQTMERNREGDVVARPVFACRKLFLAAGSIDSTKLLLRGKAEGTLSGLNAEVGAGLGNNGNVMAGRNFVAGGTGAKQSCIPVAAIDNWDDETAPAFAELAPLPAGIETWTSLYLAITRNPARGRLTYDRHRQAVQLTMPDGFADVSVQAVRKMMDRLNKANGGTMAHLLFPKGIASHICYHPLGGCVLGRASDMYGRVAGQRGLYVVDGAMLPGSTGVNPFLTITAFAERAMEHILAHDFSGVAA